MHTGYWRHGSFISLKELGVWQGVTETGGQSALLRLLTSVPHRFLKARQFGGQGRQVCGLVFLFSSCNENTAFEILRFGLQSPFSQALSARRHPGMKELRGIYGPHWNGPGGSWGRWGRIGLRLQDSVMFYTRLPFVLHLCLMLSDLVTSFGYRALDTNNERIYIITPSRPNRPHLC